MCNIGGKLQSKLNLELKNTERTSSTFTHLQHIVHEHHDMNWNHVSVLNRHQNTYSRKFLEACHTQVTSKVSTDPSHYPQHNIIQQLYTTH